MRAFSWLSVLSLVLALGCGGGGSEREPTTADDAAGGDAAGSEAPPDVETPERPLLSTEECEGQGGMVVGDIGDGATLRPDYLCPSGAPPIGNVPLGIEGAVCCPQ